MNMAHVRFHNTLVALIDCYDHIYDDDLSEDEERARKKLIYICAEITEEMAEEDESEESQ